jgi:hypothetical protein
MILGLSEFTNGFGMGYLELFGNYIAGERWPPGPSPTVAA